MKFAGNGCVASPKIRCDSKTQPGLVFAFTATLKYSGTRGVGVAICIELRENSLSSRKEIYTELWFFTLVTVLKVGVNQIHVEQL